MELAGVIVGGIALAGLLEPGFRACRDIYKGWKLTREFGEKHGMLKLDLEFQVVMLEELGNRKLSFLKKKLDPLDEHDVVTKAVIGKLTNAATYLGECNILIKKYESIDIHGISMSATTPDSPDEKDLTETNGLDNLDSAGDNAMGKDGPAPNAPVLVVEDADRTEWSDKGFVPNPASRKRLQSLKFTKKALERLKFTTHRRQKTMKVDDIPLRPVPSPASTSSSVAHAGILATSSDSSDVASTPATSAEPSILHSNIVLDASDDAKRQAVAANDVISFRRKVVWVSDDLEKLEKCIKHLRNAIQDLRGLLEVTAVKEPVMILGTNEHDDPRLANLNAVQEALNRLHGALMSANGTVTAGSSVVSIQLVSDPGYRAMEFRSEMDALTLRDDSIFVFLQVHDGQPDTEAWQVVAETTSVPLANTLEINTGFPRIENLRAKLADLGSQRDGYHMLGHVARMGSHSDHHHLFYSADDRWESATTLDDALLTEDFKHRLNPIQRTQLASLLSIAHLQLILIRPACEEIRPHNFRFYHESGMHNDWDINAPYVLNPWLCFGFGTRRRKTNFAKSSDIDKKTNNPIVEFGLLLYQVCGGDKVEYGNGSEGFRKARENALSSLRNLSGVETTLGPNFAEVVQMCLEWQDSPFDRVGRTDEEKLVRKVLHWLASAEREYQK